MKKLKLWWWKIHLPKVIHIKVDEEMIKKSEGYYSSNCPIVKQLRDMFGVSKVSAGESGILINGVFYMMDSPFTENKYHFIEHNQGSITFQTYARKKISV